MEHSVEAAIGRSALRIETGHVAKQASGSVWLRVGDTILIATATMSDTVRPEIDFFPLTCDYEERKYAVGKIPGGFVKRGGRPTEKAVLTSRLIDRPLRPLFPNGLRNEVQIIVTTLSIDHDNLSDIWSVVAASAALMVSDIPWNGPVGAVRMGRINGELIVNPTLVEIDESDLDLIVAGTEQAAIMVEAGAKEVSEADMLAAIEVAHGVIRQQCAVQNELAAAVARPKREVILHKPDEDLLAVVRERCAVDIGQAIQNPDKAAREAGIELLKEEIVERLAAEFPERESDLAEATEKVVKEQIRRLILDEHIRPDGRKTDEIRPITCEVGLLPRVHGSGLFTRGQTQVLTALTLGSSDETQTVDGLEADTEKRYMHFYNFPPYSVGETRPLRGPGRREIGHGALAERALYPMIPEKDDFPYVLLLTSEVLESNGSTSMASVCASTLALMDAGVQIQAPVAGVAMGLMSEGDRYAVLTDIQGMEDFSGDMDFKVAGTEKGITALQLDTKIQGIPHEVLVQALEQARAGRLFILRKILETIPEPRQGMSVYAPRIITLLINPEKIGEVIGPGGKMVKKIEAETGADISIEQDGKVFIACANAAGGEKAADMVRAITADVEIGAIYTGKVTRIIGMGAFVEFLPGKDGLVHISRLAEQHIRRPEDVVHVGDELRVRVIEVDSQGRVNLSAIHLDEPFEPSAAGVRPGRPPLPDRNRGGRPGPYRPAGPPEPVEDETPRARFRPKR